LAWAYRHKTVLSSTFLNFFCYSIRETHGQSSENNHPSKQPKRANPIKNCTVCVTHAAHKKEQGLGNKQLKELKAMPPPRSGGEVGFFSFNTMLPSSCSFLYAARVALMVRFFI